MLKVGSLFKSHFHCFPPDDVDVTDFEESLHEQRPEVFKVLILRQQPETALPRYKNNVFFQIISIFGQWLFFNKSLDLAELFLKVFKGQKKDQFHDSSKKFFKCLGVPKVDREFERNVDNVQ